MATYSQIKEYIKKKHGLNIETCWIAHAKELCGIPVKIAPNRIDRTKRVKPCPKNKLPHIKDAFKHFGMI